jgi:hypothetical protein
MLNEIKVRFNECCRVALGWRHCSSGSDARRALNFISVDMYILYFKILFVWKAASRVYPEDINNKLIPILHNHNTRFRVNKNFSFVLSNSNTGKRCFEVWGPALWSSLPIEIKNAKTKSVIKKWFQGTYIPSLSAD